MRRPEALQGVRMIKFMDILGRYEASEFSQLEAAALLGIGERTFRRWRQRYDEPGVFAGSKSICALASMLPLPHARLIVETDEHRRFLD